MQNIQKFIRHSKIIGFCSDFNNTMIYFFYNSLTFRILKIGLFLWKGMIGALSRSRILNYIKAMAIMIGAREVGLFIILVVAFNTAALILVGREIDIFSVIARVAFFILGLILILKKR